MTELLTTYAKAHIRLCKIQQGFEKVRAAHPSGRYHGLHTPFEAAAAVGKLAIKSVSNDQTLFDFIVHNRTTNP